MVWWDLVGDLPNKNEDARGLKIGSLNRERGNPALEKGHTKLNTLYRVQPGTKDLMREIKNWIYLARMKTQGA